MELNFTLNDLAAFAQKEQAIFEALNRSFSGEETQAEMAPEDQTLRNIMNYSRALSVRPSESMNRIEMILN